MCKVVGDVLSGDRNLCSRVVEGWRESWANWCVGREGYFLADGGAEYKGWVGEGTCIVFAVFVASHV